MGWEEQVVVREPCGLTQERCCALAEEHNRGVDPVTVDSYVLSATGCCVLLSVTGGNVPWAPGVDGTGAKIGWESYQVGSAGMGVLGTIVG